MYNPLNCIKLVFFFLIILPQLVEILLVVTTWNIDARTCLLFGETGFPEANLMCEVNEPLDFLHEIILEE